MKHREGAKKAVQRGDGKWDCMTWVSAGMGYALCSRYATADLDADGNPTKCGLHSAAGQEKAKSRRAAGEAKWRANRAEQARQRDIAKQQAAMQSAALDAVRQIAAGHNDPRSLALSVLAAEQPEHGTP